MTKHVMKGNWLGLELGTVGQTDGLQDGRQTGPTEQDQSPSGAREPAQDWDPGVSPCSTKTLKHYQEALLDPVPQVQHLVFGCSTQLQPCQEHPTVAS